TMTHHARSAPARVHSFSFFFCIPPRPPRSTLFPYTTLFRSQRRRQFADLLHLSRDAREPVAQLGDEMLPFRAAHLIEFREGFARSEEHTSELQSLRHLVCRLLLEKKKKKQPIARELHVRIDG